MRMAVGIVDNVFGLIMDEGGQISSKRYEQHPVATHRPINSSLIQVVPMKNMREDEMPLLLYSGLT